jgi:hypothetical protein
MLAALVQSYGVSVKRKNDSREIFTTSWDRLLPRNLDARDFGVEGDTDSFISMLEAPQKKKKVTIQDACQALSPQKMVDIHLTMSSQPVAVVGV